MKVFFKIKIAFFAVFFISLPYFKAHSSVPDVKNLRKIDISPFFNFVEFKFSTAFYTASKKLEKEKAAAANAGIRLSLKNADIRLYGTLPKTDFPKIKECRTWNERKSLLNDLRYGVSVSIFPPEMPIVFKAGTLSFAKSYSRLKDPSPSTSSNPLKKTFSFSTGLSPTLPTLTSSAQVRSFMFSVGVTKDIVKFPVRFEFFRNEDEFFAASLNTSFPITKFTSIETSLTGGRFFIENSSTVLKKNNAFFDPEWLYAGLAEIGFKSPFIKIFARGAIHQNPYGVNCIWLKGESRLLLGCFLLDASYFFIPTSGSSPKVAPLIGGSSSVCRTLEQAEINPQVKFFVNDKLSGSVRVGFLASDAWKITNTNQVEEFNVLKLAAAVSYDNTIFSFRTDGGIANWLLKGKPPTKSSTPEKYYMAEETFTLRTKNFSTQIKGNYKHYVPYDKSSALKQTVELNVNLAFGKTKAITADAGTSFVFKDKKRTSTSADAAITLKFQKKYVRTSLKVGISHQFI